ncbi:MAG: hypothetical protein Q8P35_00035 [Candidatus Yanofskybacteria bacterium]|nr:hypothetical protein [Candidatus Yanofskybacteria bacterium]
MSAAPESRACSGGTLFLFDLLEKSGIILPALVKEDVFMAKISGPAWQIRGAQRQQFIEHWKRRIFNEVDSIGERDERFLMKILIGLLVKAGGETKFPLAIPGVIGDFMAEAQKFARVPSEVPMLASELFQKLENSFWSTLNSQYHRDELEKTQEVYGASRASDEIEGEFEEN